MQAKDFDTALVHYAKARELDPEEMIFLLNESMRLYFGVWMSTSCSEYLFVCCSRDRRICCY